MYELRRPGGLLQLVGKTWSVLWITLRSRFAYVGELVIRTIFIVLILFIFTQLWRATGQSDQTGFTLVQLIWYLAFTEAIMTSTIMGPSDVDREVRSGDLAYRLARPLPYPLYHLGAALGERLLRFTLNLLVGVIVALFVVGPLAVGPLALALSLSLALLSFVADWTWEMTISLLSFWIEDTIGIRILYRRALMILGGMLIPLEAYPLGLRQIAEALPFQYLVYAPARLFVRPDVDFWLVAAGALLLVGAVGVAVLVFVYRMGLRQVSAQGG